MRSKFFLFAAALILFVAAAGAWQQPPGQQGQGGRGGNQQQARDRASQTPQGTATISADGCSPPIRDGRSSAREYRSQRGAGAAMGRPSPTNQGRYSIGGLTPGNYNVTASKAGFVDAVLRPAPSAAAGHAADARRRAGGARHRPALDAWRSHHRPCRRRGRRGIAARARHGAAIPVRQRGERQLSPAAPIRPTIAVSPASSAFPAAKYYVSASAAGLGELLGRGHAAARRRTRRPGRWTRRPRRSRRPGCAHSEHRLNRADRVRADLLPRRRQRARSRAGDRRAGPGSRAGLISRSSSSRSTTVSGIVSGVQTRPPSHAGAAGRRRRARPPRRADAQRPRLADGTFSIASVPPGRMLHREVWQAAGGAARSGSSPGDAAGRRERPEHRRDRAWRSAGRHAIGQHHRRIIGHAVAGRLFRLPRRRSRSRIRCPLARRRTRRRAARRRAAAPRRTERSPLPNLLRRPSLHPRHRRRRAGRGGRGP